MCIRDSSQLAFTLSNGFTYVESYLARGMQIDDFAPNLSFFFSNGMDPEYSVIGRVARRIWAVAMKNKYGANERSQKLKYHIQTSGRSLHAQEMDFNDIRTTLQALIAIYDNCNSLHTNAYDEAITTPTEESVRRAMAGKRNTSANDPWCLGYFSDNELSWGDDTSLAVAALQSAPDQPAKPVFRADLQAKYGDIAQLNRAWGTAHASWEAWQATSVFPGDAPARKKACALHTIGGYEEASQAS